MTDANVLLRQAHELINQKKTAEALAIGRQLKEMKFSGGFEILARAYAETGDLQKAIAELEAGTACCPGVWLLWNQLGSHYSDAGLFEKASAAFDKALGCEGVAVRSVEYNHALVLYRQRKYQEALQKIDRQLAAVDEPSGSTLPVYMLAGLKLTLLNALNRRSETVNFFRGFFKQIPEVFDDAQEWSMIFTNYAEALWHGGETAEALDYVRRALKVWKGYEHAQWLLRQLLKDKVSGRSFYWQVCVEGIWHEKVEGIFPGFITRYEVVADDKNEAMEFIRDFEPEAAWSSLKITEFVKTNQPAQSKGVYKTQGYTYFRKK